ncbi:gliding motility-associated C-terminal domain-containing protein [Hanstruepera ponticola]|uniref:gliding motility-associated C-terminal domain-containing protein n=1 Tax=Hanstruepera ponticola TaxID=2042995 RepID=UPI000CF0E5DD|nr:gliding motility-associated C-terminal domain-containing protein [Hanstruepera ponticola]
MLNKKIILFFLYYITLIGYCQTTDLAISVEAQDLSGSDISQAHIYQEFQYLVTITNSGDAVQNAVFNQTINSGATIISFVSQNPTGGTTLITDLNEVGNQITGTIGNFPASASIQVKVVLRAPPAVGGIATTVTITPPETVTDTNEGNNISIISIDITDIIVDFTISHEQISPAPGTPINNWDDTITYHVTITNHSDITYPLAGFGGILELNSLAVNGLPVVQLISMSCIGATNGSVCYNDFNVNPQPTTIFAATPVTVYDFSINHEFESNSTLTFEMVYQFLEPECTLDPATLEVTSHIEIALDHVNESSNESNAIESLLIEAAICQETDVCIETIQISPTIGDLVNWGEDIIFETTICNNGPLDADVLASFRNTSNNVLWQITSIECIEGQSTIPCSTTTFANAGQYWVSGTFNMPVGEILTVRTTLHFIEPECVIGAINGIARSNISIESPDIEDSFPLNNSDFDNIDLQMDIPQCEIVELQVTKTQISPQLPEGSSPDNTTAWNSTITYEIVVSNESTIDTNIVLSDYYELDATSNIPEAVLESVTCVSTSGSASCFNIEHANIGVVLDGIPDTTGDPDVFWEILEEDNWLLPGMSSVTFHVEINWLPVCVANEIKGTNKVLLSAIGSQSDGTEVGSFATTYLAPCVDLVVQTFPETPTVFVNQPFNWVVDITNSNTSDEVIDAEFVDTLDNRFTISGTPTCQVTSGNATCVQSFDITGNTISGIIPQMAIGSTVRIFIPVEAPNIGGAFVNTSEAIPSPINNEELTPETNISISSVQVLAPTLEKWFDPEIIYTDEESTLTFTVYSVDSGNTESNISFTDNLPDGLVLTSEPVWVNSNGSTGTFLGNAGDDFVGITNLNIPQSATECTFSARVTSSNPGVYTNNHTNFTNQNNIDTSAVFATLEVIQQTQIENDCLKIPQVFTPNNDNFNDLFVIPCIEDFPENQLKIYNRHGILVFQQNNYINTWDGRPNSGLLHQTDKPLPVGTYYYALEIKNESPLVGWVYLNY